MRRVTLVAATLVAACTRAPQPESAAAPTPASPPVLMRVAAGEPFFPQGTDAAIEAFTPWVRPDESGGECRVMRTTGSGATIVTAAFPSITQSHTRVTLWFDSAGGLVRYSDTRGGASYRTEPGMTQAQQDSARRAAMEAREMTSVSFDYAVDQAMAMNRGGGRPAQAITGSVRRFEALDKLGPPPKRLRMARRLCGV